MIKRKVVEKKPVVAQPLEVHLTMDIGPHLSHLFKRLFPKQNGQQAEVDKLASDLSTSTSNLKDAVEANTPK